MGCCLAALAACGEHPPAAGVGPEANAPPVERAGADRPPPPEPDWEDLEAGVAARLREVRGALEGELGSAARWGEFGMALHAHGLENEALACYAEAERLDATDFRWPYFAGLAQRFGNASAAADCLRRAGALRADYAPAWALLGNLELQAGASEEHWARAEDAFRRAVAADAGLVAAHIGLARAELARGRAEAARPHLERAATLHPRTGEVSALLEQTYRLLNDDAAAEREAARDVDRLSTEPIGDPLMMSLRRDYCVSMSCVRDRARSYAQQGLHDAAIGEWLAAVARTPDSVPAHYELAQACFRAGELGRAVSEFEQTLALDDGLAAAQRGLGNSLGALNRTEEAIAAFRRSLELDPSSQEARCALGRQLFRSGETEEGRQLIEEAFRERPEDAGIAFDRAMMLAALGENDAAVETFERALELEPDQSTFRHQYATFLQSVGRAEESEAQWKILIDSAPRDEAGQLQVVSVLRQGGRFAEAEKALRALMQKDPESARLRFELGLLFAMQGSFAEAVQAFEGASAAAPKEGAIHSNLVRALLAMGDGARAARACERALEYLPDDPVFLEQLVWLLATNSDESVRDGPRAARLADQLWSSKPQDPLVLEVRAAAHAEARDYDVAVAAANEALALLGAHPEASGLIQRIGAALRRYEREQPFRMGTEASGR